MAKIARILACALLMLATLCSAGCGDSGSSGGYFGCLDGGDD